MSTVVGNRFDITRDGKTSRMVFIYRDDDTTYSYWCTFSKCSKWNPDKSCEIKIVKKISQIEGQGKKYNYLIDFTTYKNVPGNMLDYNRICLYLTELFNCEDIDERDIYRILNSLIYNQKNILDSKNGKNLIMDSAKKIVFSKYQNLGLSMFTRRYIKLTNFKIMTELCTQNVYNRCNKGTNVKDCIDNTIKRYCDIIQYNNINSENEEDIKKVNKSKFKILNSIFIGILNLGNKQGHVKSDILKIAKYICSLEEYGNILLKLTENYKNCKNEFKYTKEIVGENVYKFLEYYIMDDRNKMQEKSYMKCFNEINSKFETFTLENLNKIKIKSDNKTKRYKSVKRKVEPIVQEKPVERTYENEFPELPVSSKKLEESETIKKLTRDRSKAYKSYLKNKEIEEKIMKEKKEKEKMNETVSPKNTFSNDFVEYAPCDNLPFSDSDSEDSDIINIDKIDDDNEDNKIGDDDCDDEIINWADY